MTQPTPIPLLALLLCLASAVARADSPATQPAYKPMPWHLVDTWWDLGQPYAFNSFSVDVEISDDLPGDVRVYLAPIGIAHLSGTPFYGGMQTQSDGQTRAEPHVHGIGPGLLMSMWKERSLDAIRSADGGFFQSSGHEGDFVSVRRPYAWRKGRYTYRVVAMDRQIVSGAPFTWVGAFLENHQTSENLFIGALRFKGERLTLERQTASFVEIYGPLRPVSDIPGFTVTFGNLQVNNEPVTLAKAEATYPKGVPDYADVAAKGDNALTITVGKPVERGKRNVKLLGKE